MKCCDSPHPLFLQLFIGGDVPPHCTQRESQLNPLKDARLRRIQWAALLSVIWPSTDGAVNVLSIAACLIHTPDFTTLSSFGYSFHPALPTSSSLAFLSVSVNRYFWSVGNGSCSLLNSLHAGLPSYRPVYRYFTRRWIIIYPNKAVVQQCC